MLPPDITTLVLSASVLEGSAVVLMPVSVGASSIGVPWDRKPTAVPPASGSGDSCPCSLPALCTGKGATPISKGTEQRVK